MRVTLFILLMFVCGSCAFFRYHSTLVNKPQRKINNVAIVIVIHPFANEGLTNRARFGAVRAVAQKLSDLHEFDFMILEREIPMFKLANKDLASELGGNYDAYITIVASNRLTDRVTLEMHETDSQETLLIEVRHSVSAENTEEAVRGAMDLFAKKFRSLEN